MKFRMYLPTLISLTLVFSACDSTSVSEYSAESAVSGDFAAKKGGVPASQIFRADLEMLNDSGVQGVAMVTVRNGRFYVKVNAHGLESDQVHPQHIHGFLEGMESTCPTLADDANDDGLIQVGEGAPAYGGILVPLDGNLDVAEGLGDLTTFPTADNGGGAVTYKRNISTDGLAINGGLGFDALSLDDHAIVLHGLTVDGDYVASLPVACGTLSAVN